MPHYSIHNDQKAVFTPCLSRQNSTHCSSDNREPSVWTVEIAIPFNEFTTAPNIPPKAGDKWLMNLYRIDRPEDGNDEYSAWQPTGAEQYHLPDKFGELVFID